MSEQRLIIGNSLDVIRDMEPESIDLCITSPPYWAVRDYGTAPARYGGWEGQLGLEQNPNDYINHLIMIFDEVKRVLKPTGACWVNLGDTFATASGNAYSKDNISPDRIKAVVSSGNELKKDLGDYGYRNKSLMQIPSRFAIAMTDSGWILRNEIIWHKPNPMPVSTKDRFTVDFEKFFFFTKEPNYYFKQQLDPLKDLTAKANFGRMKDGNSNPSYSGKPYDASKLQGKNKRAVWTINVSTSRAGHCAMFPSELIATPIDACCPPGGTVLDPFCGSGTTLEYCRRKDINAIGIEINPDFKEMIEHKAMMDIPKLETF